jgi:hypothetical protein
LELKQLIIIFIVASCVSCNNALAQDVEESNNKWLVEFIQEGLDEATAYWVINEKDNWNRREEVDIHFDFNTNIYQFNFDLKYSENWNILTHNGTKDPPRIQKRFTSSKVSFWTNFKGNGTYEEQYSKRIPNWMNFNDLDLLIIQFSKQNSESEINKLLLLEEEKIIKKLYKNRKKSNSRIWKQFEFDSKGNLIGISKKYLETVNTTTVPRSGVEEYKIRIRNKLENIIEIELLRSVKDLTIIDGIRIKNENGELVIFNSVINYKFHKFAPQIFRDPNFVVLDFLQSVQKDSGEQIERVVNPSGSNE